MQSFKRLSSDYDVASLFQCIYIYFQISFYTDKPLTLSLNSNSILANQTVNNGRRTEEKVLKRKGNPRNIICGPQRRIHRETDRLRDCAHSKSPDFIDVK